MARYLVTWDFADDEKSDAAAAYCKLDGMLVSANAWLVEYRGTLKELCVEFLDAICADGTPPVPPTRSAAGRLQGDHFNICWVGRSVHSDHEAIGSAFAKSDGERFMERLHARARRRAYDWISEDRPLPETLFEAGRFEGRKPEEVSCGERLRYFTDLALIQLIGEERENGIEDDVDEIEGDED